MRTFRPKPQRRARKTLPSRADLIATLHQRAGYSTAYLEAQSLKFLIGLRNRLPRPGSGKSAAKPSSIRTLGPLRVDSHHARVMA